MRDQKGKEGAFYILIDYQGIRAEVLALTSSLNSPTRTDVTLPTSANADLRLASSVPHAMLPTNTVQLALGSTAAAGVSALAFLAAGACAAVEGGIVEEKEESQEGPRGRLKHGWIQNCSVQRRKCRTWA